MLGDSWGFDSPCPGGLTGLFRRFAKAMMGMEERIDRVSCTMETGPVIQARGLIQGFHVSGHSRLSDARSVPPTL